MFGNIKRNLFLEKKQYMSLTLVILAAGMGSRYGGLKQLDKFGASGETLMEYALYDALQCGFDKVVFVIRQDMDNAFRQQIGDKISRHIATEYVFQAKSVWHESLGKYMERDKPWGTTHALLAAQSAVNTPFAVINADDFYGRNAYKLCADALKQYEYAKKDATSSQALMIGYYLSNVLSEHGTVSRGLCQTDQQGYLRSIVEATAIMRQPDGAIMAQGIAQAIAPETPTSMNFWGFEPTIFGLLGDIFQAFLAQNYADDKAECYISSSVNALIERGLLQVAVLPNALTDWIGVTYQADKASLAHVLQQYIQKGIYPSNLWA
jgi:UTP-glucose-1-phosphate uridylyltransferase